MDAEVGCENCYAVSTVRLLSEPTSGVNRSGSKVGTSRKRESKPSGSLTRVDAGEPLELLPGVLISSGERWCPQTPDQPFKRRPTHAAEVAGWPGCRNVRARQPDGARSQQVTTPKLGMIVSRVSPGICLILAA